ncbi:MAG: class I SAM-dependent methyltransferase [Planctomycetaceae bacterium]|nr:class I SAM-dependent methyltransferase [Planctomycetaceae bacterium]
MRVLFEVWHPERESIAFESLLCRRCGFVIYAPRPTADDLDRKYRFLTSSARDGREKPQSVEREAERAARLEAKLAAFVRGSGKRILDYGGGDGRLIAPFSQQGGKCFVVDYVTATVEGVTRLGDTLDDLDSEDRFDLIVCSHVIEHVAEPLRVLTRLRDHLLDGSVIYIEVPMEIWKKPPLHKEPVTHVNFFTVDSLRTLIQRSGLHPVTVRLEDSPHPDGHHAVVVAAIARRLPGSPPQVKYSGAAGTRQLLHPSFGARLHRALLRPTALPAAAWHKMTRRVFK